MKITILIEKDGYDPVDYEYVIPDIESNELLSAPEREKLMHMRAQTDPTAKHEFDKRVQSRDRIVRLHTDMIARSVVGLLEKGAEVWKKIPAKKEK